MSNKFSVFFLDDIEVTRANEEFLDYEIEVVMECLINAKPSLKSVELLPSELIARYVGLSSTEP